MKLIEIESERSSMLPKVTIIGKCEDIDYPLSLTATALLRTGTGNARTMQGSDSLSISQYEHSILKIFRRSKFMVFFDCVGHGFSCLGIKSGHGSWKGAECKLTVRVFRKIDEDMLT
jgi:hypothetical protein